MPGGAGEASYIHVHHLARLFHLGEDTFVFVAVIVDAYSRRVIGWALDRRMEDNLTLSALRRALSRRVAGPDLVHHSGRGAQYASGDYTDLLKENGIAISMPRKGNPWDNGACESCMKTLKYEEVHRSQYRNLAEAITGSGFTPRLAMCRLRSSKLTSSNNKGSRCAEAFRMSFSGTGKSFDPM